MDRPCQFSEGARLDRILPIFKASYRTLRNAGLSREELSGKLLGSPRTSSKYFGSTTLSYSRNVSFTGSSVPASDIRTGRVRSPSESMLFGQCNETHLQQCAYAQVDRQSCLYMGRRKACKTCFPREIGRAEQIPKKGEVSAIHADLVGLLNGKPLARDRIRAVVVAKRTSEPSATSPSELSAQREFEQLRRRTSCDVSWKQSKRPSGL